MSRGALRLAPKGTISGVRDLLLRCWTTGEKPLRSWGDNLRNSSLRNLAAPVENFRSRIPS